MDVCVDPGGEAGICRMIKKGNNNQLRRMTKMGSPEGGAGGIPETLRSSRHGVHIHLKEGQSSPPHYDNSYFNKGNYQNSNCFALANGK